MLIGIGKIKNRIYLIDYDLSNIYNRNKNKTSTILSKSVVGNVGYL